ncbi:pleckstrin homology domain-containing family J member 1-like [Limulus polyphemus]|uniref:Pleckstrin homology domain-containing family J member 1 n=1 Tax=Limulus polyphemus TaxID=6850 RepID=A0ABM1BU74_LIMPO|nr:pleckstrin homology domain-containing family J member 1-like [Limulus polyphemus]
MRFNDKELRSVALGKTDKEGRLNHKIPGFIEGYKERWFRLKGNLLFYFRVNEFGAMIEKEPVGLLVIEQCKIQHETYSDLPFSFSITFCEDQEKKHIFLCSTEKQCEDWVKILQEASYEHQRAKLLLIQAKLLRKTGKDPLEAFPNHRHHRFSASPFFRQKSLSKTSSSAVFFQ